MSCDRRGSRPSAGFSLIETLIAVVLAGIVVTAVVAGYGTALRGSTRHRSLTDADMVARSVAESIEGQAYLPCPASAYSTSAGDIAYPQGWGPASVTLDVRWWHAGTDTFTASCPDEGLQQITITVSAPDHDVARSLQIYRRSAT